jgi:hypothetical protein
MFASDDVRGFRNVRFAVKADKAADEIPDPGSIAVSRPWGAYVETWYRPEYQRYRNSIRE